MSKSWIAFTFLPFLAACAGTTPAAETAARQCTIVEHDATESHIKLTKECKPAAAAEGSSGDSLHHEAHAAPQ